MPAVKDILHPPQTRPQPIIFIAPASDIAFLAFCL
jgi:hypothetical protein